MSDEILHPSYEESVIIREKVEEVMAYVKPIIHNKLKKEVQDMLDETFSFFFDNIVDNIEYNLFESIRNRIMQGLRGYDIGKNYRDFYFEDVRKKMAQENPELITNDYVKDLEKKLEEQAKLIKYMQDTRRY